MSARLSRVGLGTRSAGVTIELLERVLALAAQIVVRLGVVPRHPGLGELRLAAPALLETGGVHRFPSVSPEAIPVGRKVRQARVLFRRQLPRARLDARRR